YHYFWPMMCSLVNQLAGTAISSRHALIGGTFWCGLGFMGLVALYLRLFFVKPAAALRRRALIGILLLGVTGLDIIPSLFFLSLWTVVTALRRWRSETLAFVLAGITCVILIFPYLRELQGPSYGPVLAWTVRGFSLAAIIPAWHGMTLWSRLILVNGPLIPL